MNANSSTAAHIRARCDLLPSGRLSGQSWLAVARAEAGQPPQVVLLTASDPTGGRNFAELGRHHPARCCRNVLGRPWPRNQHERLSTADLAQHLK